MWSYDGRFHDHCTIPFAVMDGAAASVEQKLEVTRLRVFFFQTRALLQLPVVLWCGSRGGTVDRKVVLWIGRWYCGSEGGTVDRKVVLWIERCYFLCACFVVLHFPWFTLPSPTHPFPHAHTSTPARIHTHSRTLTYPLPPMRVQPTRHLVRLHTRAYTHTRPFVSTHQHTPTSPPFRHSSVTTLQATLSSMKVNGETCPLKLEHCVAAKTATCGRGSVQWAIVRDAFRVFVVFRGKS
jgi:hypothetical protein